MKVRLDIHIGCKYFLTVAEISSKNLNIEFIVYRLKHISGALTNDFSLKLFSQSRYHMNRNNYLGSTYDGLTRVNLDLNSRNDGRRPACPVPRLQITGSKSYQPIFLIFFFAR